MGTDFFSEMWHEAMLKKNSMSVISLSYKHMPDNVSNKSSFNGILLSQNNLKFLSRLNFKSQAFEFL
jgi:hypothetical protein